MNTPAPAGRRITIQDNRFTVGGKPIWINGVNTPWHTWNDFGGAYDDSWWNEHFAKLHAVGVNAVRVWVNCNNDQGAVLIDENGIVHGVTPQHWADLDLFFATAARHQIYIMATLLSFDHFKNVNDKRPDADRWRKLITDEAAMDSYVTHYTLPFVKRYGGNPWLWSIDLCNEPEWVHQNAECGTLPWEPMSHFFARNAAAIHEHSEVLVTVGMAYPRYHAEGGGAYQGNRMSDAYLQSQYPHPGAYLDFWSPHYYDWVGNWYGVPFYLKPSGPRPDGWNLDPTKPALIGECAAVGSKGKTPGTEHNTLTTDYENAFQNGWQGVMPWTSNRVDGCGGFEDIAPATQHMLANYKGFIFPEA